MADSTASFTVGDWLVEPELDRITRNSESTGLRSQVMELLVYLARNKGRVVSTEDLLDDLWAGKVVASGTVYNCVGELRHALADGKDPHTYIETIPKKGYRLLAPVAGLDDKLESAGGNRRNMIIAFIGLMAAAIVYLALDNYVLEKAPPETPNELSQDATLPEGQIMLAVLPLDNLSDDPEWEYFSESLTKDLIAHLGRLRGDRLAVIAYPSTIQYKGKNKPVDEIGRELGADYLLEGSVQRDNDRVRVTAQLIQVSDQTQLWVESFESDLDDIFALQSEVTQRVAGSLNIVLLPTEQGRLQDTRPANAQAYEAFLKGRSQDDRRDYAKLRRAIEHYEEAIRHDPGYALAYTALAHVWGTLGWADMVPLGEAQGKAWDYTRKAAELDPDLAEVHVNFTEFRFWQYWDWAGAESEFRHAFELDPGSEMAVWHYAICLHVFGRFEEAIAVTMRGLQHNPQSRWLNESLAVTYRNSHQYERAIEQYRKTIEVAPQIPGHYYPLGHLLADLGRDGEAVAVLLKAGSLDGDSTERVLALRNAYMANGIIGYWRKRLEYLAKAAMDKEISPLGFAKIHARLGEEEQALAWVDKLKEYAQRQHVSPLAFAEIYTRLGDKDQALAWLEKAYEQRSLRFLWINVSTKWDPLRDEPRFQDLLRRMNFPE